MKKNYAFLKAFAVFSLMSISAGAQTYCSSAASSTADDEIFNVTFGSLNNSSTCGTTGGSGSILNRYSNFTAVAAPVMIQGFSYPLSFIVGQCNTGTYGGYVRVWIDYNQNGLFTDPGEQVYQSGYTTWAVSGTFMNAGNIIITNTATPGITRMRVSAQESGLPSPCSNFTWGEVEDYNIQIITPTPCSGTPPSNSVVTPTAAICPNTSALLTLSTTYTVIGITYQWQQSTVSNVGPFTSVTNGTNSSLSTPNLTTSTYYQVVVTCTNNGSAITATVGQIQISGVTTSTVPYYENFEGITANNKLPNCSWVASNAPNVTQTYINTSTQNRHANSGTKFAAFYGYQVNSSNYFYSNGIQMYAGVTYSASLWYTTEYYGYTNFTELSLMVGPNQSTVGMVMVASNAPAASAVYKALSGTFTVASSGLYYVGIKATSTGNYGAYYLSWDDLRIDVPCQFNTPTVSVSADNMSICVGGTVNLTATGANTYSWSNGATGPTISENPIVPTTYYVTGTSTLSGCPNTQQVTINVNPTPNVLVYTNKPTLCAGQSANITAIGATSYTWNTSSANAMITVQPNVTTSYTVIGGNQYNCTAVAVQQIVVKPVPTVIVSTTASDPTKICVGESVTLMGNGASTYQWASGSLFISSNQAVINPTVTTTYTVTGTSADGCVGVSTYVQNVDDCVGLNELNKGLNGVKVYPNPTHGVFTVELNNNLNKTVQVIDLTGRVIYTNSSSNEKINVNISAFAAGVYYAKIQSDNGVEVIKIVKQ